MPPMEAREVCDAAPIRNAHSACVYDSERLLVASDDGIDLIDIKTDCTIQRFYDKRAFLVDVFRHRQLVVAIVGKHHQLTLFPGALLDEASSALHTSTTSSSGGGGGTSSNYYSSSSAAALASAASHTATTGSSSSASSASAVSCVVKMEETRGANLFCLGQLTATSPLLVCVCVKKAVSIYEVTVSHTGASHKPKYKKLRDIELAMSVQSMQIIGGGSGGGGSESIDSDSADQVKHLCIGFQSEFALYSLRDEMAPIALLQPDRDPSLQFLVKDPIDALLAVHVARDEYLLVFETLGVYVSASNGCRSRVEEIMWPSRPVHVAYAEPHLLCFCERGIDVFHVRTGEWIQILQFQKTRPLDRAGALCLCNESTQDNVIRLIHLSATATANAAHNSQNNSTSTSSAATGSSDELVSLVAKSRSLIKSGKYRKGSLSRHDDHSVAVAANVAAAAAASNALNYSSSTVSSTTTTFASLPPSSSLPPQQPASSSSSSSTLQQQSTATATTTSGTSRKSLISNPINFQHIQHIGPASEQATIIGLPPMSTTATTSSLTGQGAATASARLLANASSSTLSDSTQPQQQQQQQQQSRKASNSVRTHHHHHQITKTEISAPTNFRHIVSGLDDYTTSTNAVGLTTVTAGAIAHQPQSPTNANGNHHQLPLIQTSVVKQQVTSGGAGGKSSSLSSTSSSSSSMLHSPNSPANSNNTNSNNENLSQAISNTLKTTSALYNSEFSPLR